MRHTQLPGAASADCRDGRLAEALARQEPRQLTDLLGQQLDLGVVPTSINGDDQALPRSGPDRVQLAALVVGEVNGFSRLIGHAATLSPATSPRTTSGSRRLLSLICARVARQVRLMLL
jgi:hypothetical protein